MSAPIDRLKAALADRYDVERELGRGGMATVYLARDRKHGRAVAIKVLLPDLAASVGSERFAREIELAARLRHPHIVPLFDSGEADGFLYYVMPQLVGESLRARLEREKQLPVDDALQIAREVADALSYAHAQGIVHRDIKPENILLEGGHAVVADFGIAKAFAGDAATLTETGLTVGTPAYMSPEQAAGAGDIDGRADLYSLACVLYEMLSGRTPFVGPTASSVIQQHLTLDAIPLTSLRPAVPASVAAGVSRALAKSPADRFNPVAQFSEVLRAPTATAPAVAAPTPRPRSATRVAVVLAVLVMALVGAWAARDRLGFGKTRIESIAVLPLENISGDSSQSAFVNGVHDQIIGELSRISGLRKVSPRPSVMSYRGTTKRAPEIGSELGVDALVQGSVFWAGDTVRLQVQLIDARGDRLLWSQPYDRDVRNVLAAMGEVAGTIARELGVALTGQETAHLAVRREANPQAQEHYLRGRDLVYRRDSGSIRAAIAELREAIRLDSAYAPPYALLAFTSAFGANIGLAGPDSIYGWFARAVAAAGRAMALDSLNPEGFAVRGYAGIYTGQPSDSTELVLRRALRLRPKYAEAWGWLAQAIAARNRAGALAAMDSALRLDPASVGMQMARPIVGSMIDSAAMAYEAAAPLIQLRRDLTRPRVDGAMAMLQMGRASECMSIPDVPRSLLAACLHAAGRTSEAERMLASELDALRGRRWNQSTQHVPMAYARIGQLEAALASLPLTFALSPSFAPVVAGHGFFRTPADPDGSKFLGAAARMSADAWTRVVRESKTVKFP